MKLEKAAQSTFVQKTCTYNVDKINPWGQVHQPIRAKSLAQSVSPTKLRSTSPELLCHMLKAV